MLITADARLLPLRDGCVQCVVTSPPYWGLRDYGSANQIGMEETPDAFLANLLTVFADVRRVLRPDGTLWLNIGDSYANDGKWGGETSGKQSYLDDSDRRRDGRSKRRTGLKPKDMVGIPWMLAFALRADGWYLRSDIIWHKPNPMPESVTDRPTKAHEYLFLLSKSERYYYNAAAIAEPVSAAMVKEVEHGYDWLGLKDYEGAGVQNPSSVKARIIAGAKRKNEQAAKEYEGKHGDADQQSASRRMLLNTKQARDGGAPHDQPFGLTRNKRTVWTIPTMPYAGAHFATMPEAVVEPCILAGCPVGGMVLDPFIGSGTVGAVAERLGRRWVGSDLSYQPLAKKRTVQRGLHW